MDAATRTIHHQPLTGSNQSNESNESFSLLDELIRESRVARSEPEHQRARDIIGELVTQVLEGSVLISGNLSSAVDARIAELDRLISAQVNEILHHEAFQALESTWRGLHYLCRETRTGDMLGIKMLNVTKRELIQDFNAAMDFDQSTLFKKVYEEEFGTFGGAPFGVLIGDYAITRQPEDMCLIENMAHVAAASHAPFITSASPELLGLDSFADLGRPRDLAKAFDTLEYVKWNAFRGSEDARYVGLTVPRMLGRLPYETGDASANWRFQFAENVDGTRHGSYLWMNAAYGFAVRLTHAFEHYGWCAAIRGVEGGGLVEGLPTHAFKTDDGEVALKCPTEVAITDRREKELNDLGFISLVHCKGTDYAAFFGAQSCQKAKKYNTDAANANAVLSAQLQYVFATCRIAHYLKAMMRDKIGSFAAPAGIEQFLNNWLAQYVVMDDSATQEVKAQYPLREAAVKVAPTPGRPGVYRAVAFLRPHFQLDELSVSLRLVADLPHSARG